MNSPFWRLIFKFPEGSSEFSLPTTVSGIQKAHRDLLEERKKERNGGVRGKEGKEGVLYVTKKNKGKKRRKKEDRRVQKCLGFGGKHLSLNSVSILTS